MGDKRYESSMTRLRTETHLPSIIKRTSCRNGSLTIWTTFESIYLVIWNSNLSSCPRNWIFKKKSQLQQESLSWCKCWARMHTTSQLCMVFIIFPYLIHSCGFGQTNANQWKYIFVKDQRISFKIFEVILTLIKAHLENAN